MARRHECSARSWLIVAPFVFGVSGAGLWNAVVVGSLIALAGGYNWYLTTQGKP